MTEFEINKAVAKKAGIKNLVKFDPCNNAQQAWEIMLANNICVTKDGDWYFAMNELYYTSGGSWVPSSHAVNRKPFVAAMLLFLEI